jgi:hypothetical protein
MALLIMQLQQATACHIAYGDIHKTTLHNEVLWMPCGETLQQSNYSEILKMCMFHGIAAKLNRCLYY